MKARLAFWMLQTLIALDQLINALLFFGWADETISARSWRQRHERRWAIARMLIDGLFHLVGQRDHCREAYESELMRSQSPSSIR